MNPSKNSCSGFIEEFLLGISTGIPFKLRPGNPFGVTTRKILPEILSEDSCRASILLAAISSGFHPEVSSGKFGKNCYQDFSRNFSVIRPGITSWDSSRIFFSNFLSVKELLPGFVRTFLPKFFLGLKNHLKFDLEFLLKSKQKFLLGILKEIASGNTSTNYFRDSSIHTFQGFYQGIRPIFFS